MRRAKRATSIWCRRPARRDQRRARQRPRRRRDPRRDQAEDHRAGGFRTGAGRRGVRPCPGRDAARSAASQNRDPGKRKITGTPVLQCTAPQELRAALRPGNGLTTFLSHQPQRRPPMTKVLVLYYSAYGHIEAMANAVAEGAREAGAEVDIKRVPELVPPEVAKASHYKLDQASPGRHHRRARRLRRDRGRHRHAVRPDVLADGAVFSIRPAGCGGRARCTARSAAPSPPPRPSMAARKPRCSPSSPTCCISAWSWSASITVSPAR